MEEKAVEKAVEVLRRGGLVALPTETVYGLAADAQNPEAIERVFEAKGRPRHHPLILHLGGVEALGQWARNIPQAAWKLAERFWPGPLTLLLQRSPQVLDEVTGGQETVALRVPAHPLALAVLRAFQGGLVAPSANRFGGLSPTLAQHVREDLGEKVDWVLDGGPCRVGIESTIVDFSQGGPSIARPGGIAAEALAEVLGLMPPLRGGGPRVSGGLPSHYAPQTPLVLAKLEALEACAAALCAEGKRVAVLHPYPLALPGGAQWVCIPQEATVLAQQLYALLHGLDKEGFGVLLMGLPEGGGLGSALRDRLLRAAHAHLKPSGGG